MGKVFGCILASGFSRRMQKEKLLLPLEGVPLVEFVVRAAAASSLDGCCLVYRNKTVMEIGKKFGLQTVYNPLAERGQSEAVKLAVMQASDPDAYLFLVGDQPFVKTAGIDELIRRHQEQPDAIIAAAYDGRNTT